jgi:hypothetical protein
LLERFRTDERFRIENLLKILEADTRQIIPLRFNEAQHRLYKIYRWFRDHRLPVRMIICKSRRAGLSTGVESLIYDNTTTVPNTTSLIVANEKNPSENVLDMCRTFWKYTPEFMTINGQRVVLRPPLPPQFQNSPPKDRIQFAEPLNSKIVVATARSIDGYLGWGITNVHATEAAYYVDGPGLFRALFPTISKSPDSALYIESTPNGQEGKGRYFYEQCLDAKSRKKTEYGEMRLLFVPWHEMTRSFSIPFKEESKRIAFSKSLDKEEQDLLRRFPHITTEQLQWRRMMLSGPVFNRDPEIFDQEFPSDLSTAFLVSGSSVFTRKTIKRLQNNVRAAIFEGDVYFGESPQKNKSIPIHELVRAPQLLTGPQARARGFESHINERDFKNLKVFRYPKKGERLFVAADVGGGNPETKDGDYSTMGVFVLNELERDELIMTWRGHLNPIAFAEVASAFCWLLAGYVGDGVPMPELVPEWTGPGVAMCVYIDQKNLYPSLYRYQQPGVHGMPKSKHVGWESNMKTKPLMVNYTCRMVERDMIDIPDEDVVIEMSSYRQLDSFGDTSSYGGAAGRHDDYVSMLQIGCAVLRIRSATIPGEEEVTQIDLNSYDPQDGLPSFDPFESIPGMEGVNYGDFDEESEEEANRWW